MEFSPREFLMFVGKIQFFEAYSECFFDFSNFTQIFSLKVFRMIFHREEAEN